MRFMLWSITLLFFGCAEISSEEKAQEILSKSIEAHGGWDSYSQLDTIAYRKTTRLFLEDGTLESEVAEAHVYTFIPSYSLFILSDTDYIVYNKDSLYTSVNNTVLTSPEDQANVKKRLEAANFVFFQPFKLRESNAKLEFTGVETVLDTVSVSEVKVTYPNTEDIWWFYFDANYRCVANKVLHNGRYSLIENLKLQSFKGLWFNEHRKSYFVDANGAKKYLRAEYFYELPK